MLAYADARVGQAQRRNTEEHLSLHTESFSAGGEQMQVRASEEQLPAECGDCVDDVLAVVEHEQDALIADALDERPDDRFVTDPVTAKR